MPCCDNCISLGKTNCSHRRTHCAYESCKRKCFRDNFCASHIPKPKKEVAPPPDPRIELERVKRRELIMEQERERAERNAKRLNELRNRREYGSTDYSAIDEFITKIRDEAEEERERIEREFEETCRFFRGETRQDESGDKWRRERSRKPKFTSEDTGSKTNTEQKERKFSQNIIFLFTILQIDPTRDILEIRTAYKKGAIKLHPDKNPGIDTRGRFQELSNAYEEIMEFLA